MNQDRSKTWLDFDSACEWYFFIEVLCDGYHEDELKRMEDARSLKRQVLDLLLPFNIHGSYTDY